MPYITRIVGPLISSSNPSGAKNLLALGHLDDASNLTIIMTTSAAALTSSGSNQIKISMYDPADSNPLSTTAAIFSGENFSTAFYFLSTATAPSTQLSSGNAYVINNVSFRGITVNLSLSSANTDGEIVGWVMKQVTV